MLRKPQSGKSHEYRDAMIFEKVIFQNVFHPHENEKPAFSNSSGLKSVFEKIRFSVDGRPNRRSKAAFSN